ncbi:cytochrome P450 [Actinoplanes sp. RD1]|uniref:cytochrome P450 n=1 Tax=Actinoplanes sp. RD1 TaxID=3064538 RepID=UPI0027415370|nr:cytochrome P450 [Actinoplanes sp. RD1]
MTAQPVRAAGFPFSSADPLEPPAEYARLRAREPLTRVTLPTGDLAWLVTRHADVRMVLTDPRFSREAITAPGAPRLLPIAQGSKSIFVMDPPEHSRLRGLVSRAFNPRRILRLRPRVEHITGELIDGMLSAGAPADLMAGLAQPLPITVICELLGVPFSDVGQFRSWTDVMLSFDASRRDEVITARNHLNDYLTQLIETKRAQPADDLLKLLIDARDGGDRLSQEELLAFGYTLLGAGYHATTSGIAHAVLTLQRLPGEWRRLAADRTLVPAAVEELLRLSQAGGGLGALRIAVEDVEVSGVLVRAGEAILPSINAANRDPDVFPAPDVFDLSRNPRLHLAFGYGIHHCLGAQLGRMELEVVLDALLRRMPRLAVAGGEDGLRWSSGVAFSRPAELPVTW